MGGGGASWKFKRAARRIFVQTCGSLCQRQQFHVHDTSVVTTGFCDSPNRDSPVGNRRNVSCKRISSENAELGNSGISPSCNKSLCAICLDPLNYSPGSTPGQAIFTAQCSHAFHFTCISSNVRHGSLTCPICRAQWTQLPRNLTTRCSIHSNKTDPVLRIIDDSIATFRVHRRSFLRSARYDDDDPVEQQPDQTSDQPRLHFSLVTAPSFSLCRCQHHEMACRSCVVPAAATPSRSFLHVRLLHQPAMDLVLVASLNGPHLRLMKQSMALVVSSLRPVDRLAIVTYSSVASRVFPLRRMTSYGKRTALQVVERLFHMGEADPMEGLKKGVKILEDRTHRNPRSCILHLADTPSRSYQEFDMEIPVRVFHLGLGFGASNGFMMHEFEEFIARTLGGAIRDIRLRIGERARMVGIDEMRGGEERDIALYHGELGHVCVEYRYVDGGEGGSMRAGEAGVVAEKGEEVDGYGAVEGRRSGGEGWDYHDPFMARRWAKHLHGYRM